MVHSDQVSHTSADVGYHFRGCVPGAIIPVFRTVIGRVQGFIQRPVLGVGGPVTPGLQQLDLLERVQFLSGGKCIEWRIF